jgi:hypothetical protein
LDVILMAVSTAFLVANNEGHRMRRHLESEAIEALRETLRQISVIKVKEISEVAHRRRGEKMILGHIEIYGHAHLLACKIAPDCGTERVKSALEDLHSVKRERGVVTIPILIAPTMSDEAQNLCRESGVGFLDLEGNARLYLDEVFIVKRSIPHQKKIPPRAEPLHTSEAAHFAHMA